MVHQNKKVEATTSSSNKPEKTASQNNQKQITRTTFNNKTPIPLIDQELGKQIDQELTDTKVSGTILAVKNNQTVLYESYGSSREVGWHPDESTYMLASIQKFYTALMIMELIEKDKLSLDTTLDKFYPEIESGQQITINQMLSMTSGLYLDKNNLPTKLKDKDDWEHFVLTNTSYQPSDNWSYSFVNYTLLAMIIEKVTDQSYEEYFTKTITEPLQLKQTGFYQDIDDNTHLVPAYLPNGNKTKKTPNYAYIRELGTGNMWISPQDFLTTVQAVVDGFFGDLALTQSIWNTQDTTPKSDYRSGLYHKKDSNDQPFLFAHGIFRGYEPSVFFNNDASTAVIFFSNDFQDDKSNIAKGKDIYNQLLTPIVNEQKNNF